ncbi:MAG: cobalamin transport system substrate-binding protein [Acidobacteriaceae bacterium]|nr:cobalamin transport system substrate-binding protein [Acidobacteriaceae bacterium]
MPRFLAGLFFCFLDFFAKDDSELKHAKRFEWKDIAGLLLPALLAVIVAAPAARAAQTSSPASTAAPSQNGAATQNGVLARNFREVIDETGRTVRIPQPVMRIVSLAPSLTETVYALGLQDRLVGDTDYCDYPPEAQKKQKVGGPINPSLEEIAHLRPDVVLVTRHLNTLDTVHSLDALGIPSYATDPRNVDEIVASAKRLGDVLGAAEAGEALTGDLQHRLDVLRHKIGVLPPRRVLFVVWTDPLISIGKDTFIADALRRAGAVSIIDSKQDWPHVNLEEVAHLQPEVLVFADSHSETTSQHLDVLATRPAWRIMNAVRERKFAVISEAVNRPAPRIVTAIEELAEKLHPEAFVEKPVSNHLSGNTVSDAKYVCAR